MSNQESLDITEHWEQHKDDLLVKREPASEPPTVRFDTLAEQVIRRIAAEEAKKAIEQAAKEFKKQFGVL